MGSMYHSLLSDGGCDGSCLKPESSFPDTMDSRIPHHDGLCPWPVRCSGNPFSAFISSFHLSNREKD